MNIPVILIIDAEERSRSFLSHSLNKNQVITAVSGREGLITAWKEQPDLIIIDPNLPDIAGVEVITKLRKDQRTAQIPIITLSGSPSPELISQCMQAGSTEGLIKSKAAIPALIDMVSSLTHTNGEGALIVFISAKGGTGTTSLCANFAANISEEKKEIPDVAVIDLVLPIGSIANIVGIQSEVNLISYASLPPDQLSEKTLRKKLPVIADWNFSLLPGSPDPESSNHLNISNIPSIIRKLQKGFKYTFVDLGRSLSRISLPVIQRANAIVLILSADLSTATHTKLVWDYLQNNGIRKEKMYAILNRAVGLEGLTIKEASEIIGLPIPLMVPYMGSNFTLANNQDVPLLHKFPNDTAALVLKRGAKEISALAQKGLRS